MRALYVAGGGVGNVVMATPAMAAMAEMGYRVSVLLDPGSAATRGLLEGWSALEEVLSVPPRPEDFDVVVRSVWAETRIQHPRVVSAPKGAFARGMHESEVDLLPVRLLGYVGAFPPTHVECETSAVTLEPGTYWAFAPGCNPNPFWERKRWKGWEGLARALGGLAVFLGTAQEAQPWMGLEGRLCLAGRTSLREAAGWLACSKAFVAIDNGLAHVGTAAGASGVVLFGATSVAKNRPLGPRVAVLSLGLPCAPCQMTPRWDECRDWRCMDFSVEQVASDARRAARFG